MRRAPDWVLGLLLGLLLVAGAFPRALTGREVLLASSPLKDDPVYAEGFAVNQRLRELGDASAVRVHYPADTVAAHELRAGRMPLWNPYVGTGMPLLAEAHSAPLSPLLLPFVAAPSEKTYTWYLLLRLVLAAAGAFVFARRRGLTGAAATLAAVTYAMGGVAAAYFDLPTGGAAHAMLPLCALAAAAVVEGSGDTRRPIAAVALTVGATIYAAHPVVAACAGLGGPLIAGLAEPKNGRAWARLAAGVALGTAVGALVVLPFLGYLAGGGSTYKFGSLAAMQKWFGPETDYLKVVPDLLRVGSAALLLAAMAAISTARAPALVGTLRAVAATLLLTAVLFLLHLDLPARLGWIVLPRYTIFLAVFSISILAGEGLDALRRGTIDRRAFGLGALVAATIWIACDVLTSWRLQHLPDIIVGDALSAVAVTAAVLVADRVPRLRRAAAFGVVGVATLTLMVSARRAVGDGGGGIPDTAPARAVRELGRARSTPAPARVAGKGNVLTANTAALLGVADVRAVAAIFPARYRAYMTLVNGALVAPTWIDLWRAKSPLLDLIGVTHVVTFPPPPDGWPVAYRDSRVAIAMNPRAAPRVLVPRELETAGGPDDSLRRLARLVDEGRLPGTAVVEAPPGALAPLAAGSADARITAYHPRQVEIAVDAAAPALVVLTDTWDAGWHAQVNGQSAPIYPTDHLFRGVPVPAGKSLIMMTYCPRSYVAGVWVAGVSLAVTLGLFFAPSGRPPFLHSSRTAPWSRVS